MAEMALVLRMLQGVKFRKKNKYRRIKERIKRLTGLKKIEDAD